MKRAAALLVAIAASVAGAAAAAEKRSSGATDSGEALVGAPARDVWQGWLWIPISEAIDENGAIVPGRLPDYRVRQLSEFTLIVRPSSKFYDATVDAVRRGSDCLFSSARHEDRLEPRPNRLLADLVASADRILEGTVVGEHGGLLIGEVGALLEVSVDRTLKGDRLDQVFLFYPLLKTMVGSAAVCRQSPFQKFAPRSGDRVLFFGLADALNERRNLFYPEPTELIFGDAHGQLGRTLDGVLPPGMKTFEELRTAVGKLLEAP